LRYLAELSFKGRVELLAGREYAPTSGNSYESPGAAVTSTDYFLAPGTVITAGSQKASFDPMGRVIIEPR
jgi:hypothetical protein